MFAVALASMLSLSPADEAAQAAVAVELAKLSLRRHSTLPRKGGGKAPPVQPFRGPAFHAGHACPHCGRYQFRIAGHNGDGTHTHVCAACATAWRH